MDIWGKRESVATDPRRQYPACHEAIVDLDASSKRGMDIVVASPVPISTSHPSSDGLPAIVSSTDPISNTSISSFLQKIFNTLMSMKCKKRIEPEGSILFPFT